MKIIELNERQDLSQNPELNRMYNQLGNLLIELRKKSLPDGISEQINHQIVEVNNSLFTGNSLKALVKQRQTSILKLVEKKHKIVSKSYYTNLWLVLGMTVFGLPIGIILGLSIDNMGMIPIGFPLGIGIGTGLGLVLDKKALAEGRQLDIEIK